jgi:hypothetical protein
MLLLLVSLPHAMPISEGSTPTLMSAAVANLLCPLVLLHPLRICTLLAKKPGLPLQIHRLRTPAPVLVPFSQRLPKTTSTQLLETVMKTLTTKSRFLVIEQHTFSQKSTTNITTMMTSRSGTATLITQRKPWRALR